MNRPEPAQAIDVLLASRSRFLSFLRGRAGDEATAEGVLQSAYVKALEGASSIRDHESVVAWFHRVLRNAVVDHYRRRGACATHGCLDCGCRRPVSGEL